MLIFNIDNDSENLSPKKLIFFAEMESVTDDIAKEYLATRLAADENVLSSVCQHTENIGQSLWQAAYSDITSLWHLLSKFPIKHYIPTHRRSYAFKEYEQSIIQLTDSASPEALLQRLIAHYKTFGAGENAKYFAFKWEGALKGIENPDDIALDELYCLERQKKTLIENTAAFLQGLPCENALLYGSRGSGKSSMTKAILNAFYTQGLRMAEIPRAYLNQLSSLIDHIKSSMFKYIIFMDDLSFEDSNDDYKALKVALEGQIEKRPNNILFYATSNRRHLVSENWAERQTSEVHAMDTINEKLSLAERFAVNIHFQTLGQDEYLTIVQNILQKNNIEFTDSIKTEALKWCMSKGGRSGRIAAQFAYTIGRL